MNRGVLIFAKAVPAFAAAFVMTANAAAETHIVEMRGLEYVPAEVDAAVGDTITWVNTDVLAHTATAADGAWDSGLMMNGDEWSLVVESAGRIEYACTPHPVMTGVINVR